MRRKCGLLNTISNEESSLENCGEITTLEHQSMNDNNSRTNQLSTILENVKGEEKEIKNSSPNQAKVLKDKQNKPEVSGDKVSSELNPRPLSSVSEPGYRSNSVSSQHSSKKPKKVYSGIRFTKKELEYYLPKRSNFSCHEKALKDGGYDLEAIETKRRRRLTRKQNIKDKEIEEKLKEIEDVNAAPVVDVESPEKEIKDADEEQTEMERSNKPKRKGKKKMNKKLK
ncbi:unnamed protein product [Mytilus edulis]|uniref:Uncharacterized protein n=1 Tax=Mytilus edulis TaxID=6550 RepID=A0A8S3U021_MYTED|nr:unnamed protein product [Mytilus edulis]